MIVHVRFIAFSDGLTPALSRAVRSPRFALSVRTGGLRRLQQLTGQHVGSLPPRTHAPREASCRSAPHVWVERALRRRMDARPTLLRAPAPPCLAPLRATVRSGGSCRGVVPARSGSDTLQLPSSRGTHSPASTPARGIPLP